VEFSLLAEVAGAEARRRGTILCCTAPRNSGSRPPRCRSLSRPHTPSQTRPCLAGPQTREHGREAMDSQAGGDEYQDMDGSFLHLHNWTTSACALQFFCMRPSISIEASLIWTRSLLNREELGEGDRGERGFSWRDVELARRIGGGWFNLVFYPIVGPTYFYRDIVRCETGAR
jgi:hypothetical protein